MNKIEELNNRVKIASKWKNKIWKYHYTISELSKISNISRTTIYNAINGTTIPNDRTVHIIETVLCDGDI